MMKRITMYHVLHIANFNNRICGYIVIILNIKKIEYFIQFKLKQEMYTSKLMCSTLWANTQQRLFDIWSLHVLCNNCHSESDAMTDRRLNKPHRSCNDFERQWWVSTSLKIVTGAVGCWLGKKMKYSLIPLSPLQGQLSFHPLSSSAAARLHICVSSRDLFGCILSTQSLPSAENRVSAANPRAARPTDRHKLQAPGD